jgi:hypothetical protein
MKKWSSASIDSRSGKSDAVSFLAGGNQPVTGIHFDVEESALTVEQFLLIVSPMPGVQLKRTERNKWQEGRFDDLFIYIS